MEVFPVYGMEPGNFFSLRHGTRKLFQFTEWKLEFFRVTGWNLVFFSGLRNKNLNFSETFRNSGTGFRKNSGFHFIRKCPGIPLYGTNFRIIPFPKWNFYSGIIETLCRSNRNWVHFFFKKVLLTIKKGYLQTRRARKCQDLPKRVFKSNLL